MSYKDPEKQKEYFRLRFQRIKETNREPARKRMADWRKANPDKNKLQYNKDNVRRKYGLTLDQLNDMLVAQDYKCAICKQAETNGRRLAIDHCHKTCKVRALLCSKCNNSLGLLKEDENIVLSLLDYLRNHSVKN